jgi:Co/Zn/Cd efflux system component
MSTHTDDPDHDDHAHDHAGSMKGITLGIFIPHGQNVGDSIDTAVEPSRRGIRAVEIPFVSLAITSALQLAVILISGSITLVADKIHNFSDALTAIPRFAADTASHSSTTGMARITCTRPLGRSCSIRSFGATSST